MEEIILNIKSLNKSYQNDAGGKQIILENLSLKIKFSENSPVLVSILAPFGSGKTTLLKIIAGLENSEGEVYLNDERITEPNCKIIYIPERQYAYPWLSVKENIELPLKLNKKIYKRNSLDTNELIDLIGLKGYEDFIPKSAESGFSLRIAIARALTVDPKLILLDDVLKNLDSDTRGEIIELLIKISAKIKSVFIFTTTNISDAIELSHKILLMRKNPGKIIKEISIPEDSHFDISEIITKYKNEIEETYKSQYKFQSVLLSL